MSTDPTLARHHQDPRPFDHDGHSGYIAQPPVPLCLRLLAAFTFAVPLSRFGVAYIDSPAKFPLTGSVSEVWKHIGDASGELREIGSSRFTRNRL